MSDRDSILQRIDELEGDEQRHTSWLLSLLDHEDNLVRFSAIRPLIYRCVVPTLEQKLWHMLEIEPDEDVMLHVISGLARYYRGTGNKAVIRRFKDALDRMGGGLPGTRETLDDAKLSIMSGYDSKQLVKMSSSERQTRLTEANLRLQDRNDQAIDRGP